MIDVPAMIRPCEPFSFLRRLLDPTDGKWKSYVFHQLRASPFATEWGLDLQVIISAVKASATSATQLASPFWRSVLNTAQQLNLREIQPTLVEHVLRQPLFYNQLIVSPTTGAALGDITANVWQTATSARFTTCWSRTCLCPQLRSWACATRCCGASTTPSHQHGQRSCSMATPRASRASGRSPCALCQLHSFFRSYATCIQTSQPTWISLPNLCLATPLTCPWRCAALHYCNNDSSFSTLPSSASLVVRPLASLIRAHVAINNNTSSGIVEGALDTMELLPDRIVIEQGPRCSPTPILESTVHATRDALTHQQHHTTLDLPARLHALWQPLLHMPATSRLPWSRIWRWVWAMHHRQRVSDFLWRSMHHALSLGHDRRHFDDATDCPSCLGVVETYEHFLFTCPVSAALWRWFGDLYTRLSPSPQPQQRQQLLLCSLMPGRTTPASRAFTRVKAVIHGELLYALWLQRCRAKFDDDPHAFTATSVHAVATLNIRRSLVALEQARPLRSESLTDAVFMALIRLSDTPLPPLSRPTQQHPLASSSTSG